MWHFGFISFGSMTMLLWAFAAAAPVLIHLLSRRKYQRMTWAAMDFLLAALRRNARRMRLEQLLLLCVRVATLLLFSLALSDLSCRFSAPGAAPLGSRNTAHTVIVIDASFSMAYRVSEKTCFQLAQDMAISLVNQSHFGDGFSLILMGEPPQTVIGAPVFDRNNLANEIHEISVRHQGSDLNATLAAVASVLKESQTDSPHLSQTRVYFFTDLSMTTWSAATSVKCQTIITQLAESASLILVDVGPDAADNLAVTNLRVAQQFVTRGKSVSMEANIQHFGAQSPDRTLVQWFIDGSRVHQEFVTLEAEGQATVSIQHSWETIGEHRVEVQLAEDRLDIDNHRWLSTPVHESMRVLCVRGKPDAARFVRFALQPSHSNSPDIQPQSVSNLALLDTDLFEYDCVFLCNLDRIGGDEARALHDFVKAGRGIITFLGDQVVAESYNRQIGGMTNPFRLLPARIETVSTEANYGIDPHDYLHQIVKPFRGNQQAGLLTTPVWRYFQLTPYTSPHVEIAASFQNGDPAIVTDHIKDGRSIVVATAGSTASIDRSDSSLTPWTALPTWPSFLPLVHEMLKYAIQGRDGQRNVEVGQPLRYTVQRRRTGSSVTLTTPDQRRVTLRSSSSQWSFPQTFASGIYQARFESSDQQPWLFAANVNTRESDLHRIDVGQLPDALRKIAHSADDEAPMLSRRGWPIFRLFLGGVLGLILVESFLVWRFGNRV